MKRTPTSRDEGIRATADCTVGGTGLPRLVFAGTTTASAATFTYDEPAIARLTFMRLGRFGQVGPAQRCAGGVCLASGSGPGHVYDLLPLCCCHKQGGRDRGRSIEAWSMGYRLSSVERSRKDHAGRARPLEPDRRCQRMPLMRSVNAGVKSGNWIGDHQPVSRTVTPALLRCSTHIARRAATTRVCGSSTSFDKKLQ